MKEKSVLRTFPAAKMDMGGIPVYQPFPTARVEQIDPFLLFHHSTINVKEGSAPLHAGVGPHPHRGFMPLTYVVKGSLHHRDSFGNSSVISEGGAQWLSAGRGIIHSERPSREIALNGGSVEVLQIWINLPKSHKMETPWYRGLEKDDLVSLDSPEGVTARLISGNYEGVKGPIQTPFPMFVMSIQGEKGSSGSFKLPTNMKGGIYVIEGFGKMGGFGLIEEKTFYELDEAGEEMNLQFNSDFHAILLLGEPLNEPLATYGPFVMNSQTEVLEAMRDYNQGKMGILIEE